MSILKKLASDTAMYGVSSIVGRLLNWLLVIVHTRIFEQPRLLSGNNQLYTYVIVLNILYTLGMETTLARFAAKHENRQEYYNQIMSFIVIISVVLSGIFIIFATPIINLIGFPGEERLMVWFAIILATDAIAAIAFVKIRLENKAKHFVKIKLAGIFINIGLNVFYLMFCKIIYDGTFMHGQFLPTWRPFAAFFYNPKVGADYIVWANFVASLATLLLLWKEFVGFKFNFNADKFKPLLRYAFPLFVMGLAGTMNLTADRQLFRFILPHGFYPGLTTEDAFGIYSNVYKLSIFMTLVVQAYRYASEPIFFSKAEDKNSTQTLALATKWFTIACIFIWIGVSLNLDLISRLIGKNYRSGVVVVPLLLLGNLFIGVYQNLSIWFKLGDKTHYGTWITVFGMLITVLLNILLIPRMGYMGCAYTFVISSFLMCVVCYIFGQKNYPIPYDLLQITCYLVLAALLIFSSSFIKISNPWASAVFHSLLCVLFFIGLAYSERKTLKLEKYFG